MNRFNRKLEKDDFLTYFLNFSLGRNFARALCSVCKFNCSRRKEKKSPYDEEETFPVLKTFTLGSSLSFLIVVVCFLSTETIRLFSIQFVLNSSLIYLLRTREYFRNNKDVFYTICV
uniref:Uncharacterized protein n=1 Tax=Cacopsylla melanoneura TaxID=428564 RepID=A0A8D9BF13_9HEMI